MHGDPALNVALAGVEAEAAIAEWRRLARQLNLPLLVEDAAGRLQSVPDGGISPPFMRRAGRWHRRNRPRFLARRNVGVPAQHRRA